MKATLDFYEIICTHRFESNIEFSIPFRILFSFCQQMLEFWKYGPYLSFTRKWTQRLIKMARICMAAFLGNPPNQ